MVILNPYHGKFLKWNNPPFFGAVHYHFQGYQDENLKLHGQPTVYSLVRPHGCAGKPGSILVAKANHFRFQQDKD